MSAARLSAIFDRMRGNLDPVVRARAENALFEERLAGGRYDAYCNACNPAEETMEAWVTAHTDYLRESVWIELPETFTSLNSAAALPPSVTSDLGADQFLFRVESLDCALTQTKVTSLPDLEDLLAIYRNERTGGHVDQAAAKAALEEVCDSLNRNPNAVRPRFAAFAEELVDDAETGEWADRLRDRLGMAHMVPTDSYGPRPVALMRYPIRAVMDRARRQNAANALAVPTHLDGEPCEYFHPAPSQALCGRTLNLMGNPECDRFASEILHLRIDYTPQDFFKVGAITTRPDLSSTRLAELREGHLFCLRYLNDREDFGAL